MKSESSKTADVEWLENEWDESEWNVDCPAVAWNVDPFEDETVSERVSYGCW